MSQIKLIIEEKDGKLMHINEISDVLDSDTPQAQIELLGKTITAMCVKHDIDAVDVFSKLFIQAAMEKQIG